MSPLDGSSLSIDYVSPLPPVRSGIADYSRDLLPHLARHCDLRVVAVPGQPISEDLVALYRPVEASEIGGGDRLPLYHMGNNIHHAEVWRLAVSTPGVVALHDVVLHHLLIESTLGRGDYDSYARRLEADHGWIGRLVARARRWGELSSSAVFELPAHRDLVRRQRGILVHSTWAAAQVGEENPDVAVRVVPMGVPLPEIASVDRARGFREKHQLPANRPVLGSFGFQTPIKRTEVAVRALAEPELAEAHLVIAGEVSPVLDLEDLAREIGVEDRVHITGFLGYDEFEAAISACDICVNLRYPTAGETSASLLRVLAAGRPALVSDYAQFAELPDDAVVKVPLGDNEAELLAKRVAEVVHQPDALRRMGEAARELVRERHDPDRAAHSFVEACGELRALDPPGSKTATVDPPTTLLWRDLPGEIEVDGAEAPWAEGEERDLAVRVVNSGPARWLPSKERLGGVILDVQWRLEPGGEAMERSWAPLQRPIDEGEHCEFRLRVRRPLGSRYLVVEPHVEDIGGFSKFGGPTWIMEY